MKYSIGDVLVVKFPGFMHYGVYVGANSVIHNSKELRKVVKTTIKKFSGGRDVLVSSKIKPQNRDMALQLARQYLGVPYQLFSENCEHFVRVICGMKKESKQVQKYLTTALGVGIALKADSKALKMAGGAAALIAMLTPEEDNPARNALIAGCLVVGIAYLAKK
ncbi:MAG: lecithin retinol acyltransferase family protein [Gammaproteobacteria bacterium]